MPNVPLMHHVQKMLSHLNTRLQSARSPELAAPFGPEGIVSKLQAQPCARYRIQIDMLSITRRYISAKLYKISICI